jgi:hypothetical protein
VATVHERMTVRAMARSSPTNCCADRLRSLPVDHWCTAIPTSIDAMILESGFAAKRADAVPA